MRIFNHEHIPCKPDVLVPTFTSKKDNIANSVVAYMVLFLKIKIIKKN